MFVVASIRQLSRRAAPVVGVRALAAAAAACATMLVLAACALAIPRSRDLHASATRLEADLDAIETLIAERRVPCGSEEQCAHLCSEGKVSEAIPISIRGYTADDAGAMLGVYNSKVPDKSKVEFSKDVLEAEFKKCLDECNKHKDETAHDLYLELPLKTDGSKTVKFNGNFRPTPNIPIFLVSWCD